MTANKKKKPANNPVRGFATTSIPAKPRAKDEPINTEGTGKTNANQDSNQVFENSKHPASSINPSGVGVDIHKLTPEDLEAHLEESALQLLLENSGEKSKKAAARQVVRLKTEKRLLRPQSERIDVNRWLPEEIVELIFRLYQLQQKAPNINLEMDSKQKFLPISDEDLITKVWTLELVCSQLGFTKEDIRCAIHALIRSFKSGRFLELSVCKDLIWGLGECLDSLTLMCHPKNLPDYEAQSIDTGSKTNKKIHRENKFIAFEAHQHQDEPIFASKNPKTLQSKHGLESSEAVNMKEESPFNDIHSESEEDNEPENLVNKYISLQTQIFELSSDSFPHVEDKKVSKSNPKLTEAPRVTPPKLARLYMKVEKIESDILFDRFEASVQWTQIQNQLAKESAERRKLQLDENSQSQKSVVKKPSSKTANKSEEDDATFMFGDLFTGPLEPSVAGSTDSMVTGNDQTAVTIRDFGKWTGVSPRRVFENACKARDSSCRVTYNVISEVSFSYRYSLLVEWSYSQDLVCPIEDPLNSYEASNHHLKVQMAHIATSDIHQSEAYISTVALFFMSASVPKEEKLYLHLPVIWRDLWAELLNKRKEQIEAADRIVLRELRDIISGFDNTDNGETHPYHVATSLPFQQKQSTSTPNSKPDSSLSGEEMKEIWASKSSTPAYRKILNSRIKLPIWNFKDLLLKTVDDHQVVIVCGETGCGKSTQVPSFILENELSNGRHCKVYCTEPRRISAISLARRVGEELGEQNADIGTSKSLVGYAIRLESQITTQTRLVYATTGIVMRMLERSIDLGDITHLILDEVHERSIDSDFLLIVLRKLMDRRPTLKVILMSATVDAGKFSKYLAGAPVINVPGRTFPVEIKYLEDVLEITGFEIDGTTDGKNQVEELRDEDDVLDVPYRTAAIDDFAKYDARTSQILARIDEYQINYGLILKLLETIAKNDAYTHYSKAILIFLPGIAEIRRLNDIISGQPLFAQGWNIYPLHSTIATEDQERAFLVPLRGTRKIVLATNIAETGITIPDITCVIDTGKHREIRYDERRQLSRLIESFISKANAKQRRGRAGRVQSGLCFHMFTRARYDNHMPEEQTPEMLRLSLQDLVLRVKICKLGGIEQTLLDALDPPSSKNIQHAIDSLVDVKALTIEEELTPLGRQLAKLPLDVFLGKLVLLGTIYHCLDGVLSIAATLSSKSPFQAPMGARAQADLSKLAFRKGESDLLTVYNAYDAWRKVCNTTGGSEQQFCRKNFLNPQTLSNIEELKAQLLTSLIDAGFVAYSEVEKSSLNRVRFHSRQKSFVEIPNRYNSNNNNEQILNSVLAWSFYPKLLARDGKGWRNIANNQAVSLHPTSVNKGIGHPLKWLSYYHIMQSSNKFYNAHETSSVENFALALACGDAEFKMYAGVLTLDNNRIRLSLPTWKATLALKILRTQIQHLVAQAMRHPGRALTPEQQAWMAVWRGVFAGDEGPGGRDVRGLEEVVFGGEGRRDE